jgi:hypothetical protein
MLRQPKDIILKSGQTLEECLKLHKLWLENKEGGVKADLTREDLFGANLSNVNLSNANLSNANLFGADLSNADLSNADLFNVNLSYANLSNVNLSNANLSNANLSNAKLSNVNLYYANLFGANLYGANLSNATFKIADQNLVVSNNFTRVIGSRHDGYRVGDYLKIGCKEFSIPHWVEHVVEIAKEAGYTPEQVTEYGDIVAFVALRAGY